MSRLAVISPSPVRASDADRERSMALLREHWLAGRLTLEEYEDRCDEIAAARYVSELTTAARELPAPPRIRRPPTGRIEGAASVALGGLAIAGLVMSIGLLVMLTLPASACAWMLGRRARKLAPNGRRALALTGETLGITGTALGCLVIAGFVVLMSAI